jgi:hypothetical protein
VAAPHARSVHVRFVRTSSEEPYLFNLCR